MGADIPVRPHLTTDYWLLLHADRA